MSRWMLLIGGLVAYSLPCPAQACKFCPTPPPSLRVEAKEATIIVYGRIANPRPGKDGNGNLTPDSIEGTSDLFLDHIIKSDPTIAKLKRIELQRVVAPGTYLIFLDVYKGKIDPYKGILATPAMVDYLKGITALDPAKPREILAFAFRHLEHADPEIAIDAFKEFTQAEYKDYRDFARTFRPDLLARWLKNAELPQHRRGMYAFLLGHCGNQDDAKFLRKLIDDEIKQGPTSSGFDQLLLGYTFLQPQEGLQLIHQLMKDPNRDFVTRYAGLRAVRFLWDSRPGVVPRQDLIDGFLLFLNHSDAADLVIEDLRRRELWHYTGIILALADKEDFAKVPIIRRSLVRYSLSCPLPEAKAHVAKMRKLDAEMVENQEEMLKLEEDLKKQETPKS